MRKNNYLLGILFSLSVFVLSCTNSSNTDSSQNQGNTEVQNDLAQKSVPNYTPEVKKAMFNNGCLGCHKVAKKLIGPSFVDIAQKAQSETEVLALIRKPNPDNWPGYPPMTPVKIGDVEGKMIAKWIMSLKVAE